MKEEIILKTAVFTAPDISCNHCKMHIEKAVGALPGVTSVSVEVPSKKVTVQYDAARIAPERIEATMAEEGYPAGQP